MSQQLINRNHDLKRLRDDGYEIDVVSGHLVMRNVPYVNAGKQVLYGTLVSELSLSGDVTVTPQTHVINFAGEYPCDADGKRLDKIVNSESTNKLAEGLTVNYSFSSKPVAGYKDYYDKMTTYEKILSGAAQAIDPSASAKNFAVVASSEADSPFQYIDTASSRAEIGAVSNKLKMRKVAIIGLGGTGSYVLDLIAKTPVQEIHLFDGDWFYQHNAFRVPGAASLETLRQRLKKVDYMHGIYSNMHRGIIPHAYKVALENIEEFADMDFVFICIDDGPSRKMIVTKLEEFGVAFIDVGMGVYLIDEKLGGQVRITSSTDMMRDHVHTKERIPFGSADGNNEYNKNIQIADLNCLNATMAVIKWKKLLTFYHDFGHEHHSVYTVDGNRLTNDDKS